MTKRVFLTLLISILCLPNFAFGQISIAPSDGNIREFIYEIEAGKTQTAELTIKNLSTTKTLVQLQGVDATQSHIGTFAYTTSDYPQTSIGKWTKIESPQIELDPVSVKTVRFSISVPEDVSPGSYIGGIAAEEIKPSSEGDQVKVSARIMTKILINVPGETTHKYKLESFEREQKEGKDNFIIKTKNLGNSLVTVKTTLTIEGFPESGNQIIAGAPINIHQEETNTAKLKWSNEPSWGIYTVKANIEIGQYDFLSRRSTNIEKFEREIQVIIIPSWLIIVLIILVMLPILIFISRKLKTRTIRKNCSDYKVKDGEEITDIAERYKINWKLLAKINRIGEPYHLEKDQIIMVPKTDEEKIIQKSTPSNTTPVNPDSNSSSESSNSTGSNPNGQ